MPDLVQEWREWAELADEQLPDQHRDQVLRRLSRFMPQGLIAMQPALTPVERGLSDLWRRSAADLAPDERRELRASALDRLRGAAGPEFAAGLLAHGPDLARRTGIEPLPYREVEWGDGSYSPLYCCDPVRVDDALGDEVNERLVAWAEGIGLHAGRIDKFRDTGFGRLAMLTHTDTDDPDRLLIAARMNAAWWACDDYYADETDLGATPVELPPRLALVMSAMDPPPPAGGYTGQLEEHIEADPVLVALRSATAYLACSGTPAQVMRACGTTFQMYVSWAAYAAWRHTGELPEVWRYLAARQHDSFYTSMTLIDVVGGYELTGNLFHEKRFHRALMQAGTAAVLVNDLYSVEREAADELPDSNVVLLIAAEEGCTIEAATERTVALHNDFVHAFEAGQRELMAVPSPELQRFLRGAQAWMAGGLAWHDTSSRYR